MAAKPSYYFTEVNPAGLVPVLQLGADREYSVKIPESAIIIDLIGDLFPASGVVPADPIARAEGRYFAGVSSTSGNLLFSYQLTIL